jgi:hypothetical protein
VVGLQAEAGHPARGVDDQLLLVEVADLDVDVDPGVAQLLGRLLLVPTVAHEERFVGPDQQERRRPGEAGEVADVDQTGHQQGVTARLVQLAPQPFEPRGEVHRGQVGEGHSSSNRSATVAIALG